MLRQFSLTYKMIFSTEISDFLKQIVFLKPFNSEFLMRKENSNIVTILQIYSRPDKWPSVGNLKTFFSRKRSNELEMVLKWLATATTHLSTLFLLLFGKEDVKYRAKPKDNKCFL